MDFCEEEELNNRRPNVTTKQFLRLMQPKHPQQQLRVFYMYDDIHDLGYNV